MKEEEEGGRLPFQQCRLHKYHLSASCDSVEYFLVNNARKFILVS